MSKTVVILDGEFKEWELLAITKLVETMNKQNDHSPDAVYHINVCDWPDDNPRHIIIDMEGDGKNTVTVQRR